MRNYGAADVTQVFASFRAARDKLRVLGRTLEWVELPDDIVARIEGKSSLGRLGMR